MTPELETTLRELESATAAVVKVVVEDFAEAKAAMDRRSWAIADLATLAAGPIPERDRDEALRRLRLVSEAGEKAGERLVSLRSSAAAEWSQWNQIYRALGPARSPKIDCRG
jgi:hypothetical protein